MCIILFLINILTHCFSYLKKLVSLTTRKYNQIVIPVLMAFIYYPLNNLGRPPIIIYFCNIWSKKNNAFFLTFFAV